ncbi:unnamed protein product [Durusdinium trenchii]|uniref:Uncharacterized protein n=1 Tax=Durusdinium trenchii TaxID=1381693 RepID=A0ABP0JRE3_9DINO
MSGFSCTSYSSLNNQSHLNLNAVQESKAVASVDTFKGCVGLIRYTRPRLFLLENVPRIDAVEEDQSSSNLDQCLAILRNVPRLSKEDTGPDLCYSVKPFLMNTLWYGLPQNRERVYVVGVKTSGDELGVHPDVYLERVQLYLSKMYVNPPSPDELLFDDDHPAVLAELERLQKVRSNNGLSTGASSDKSQNWVKMHMNLAEKRSLQTVWHYAIFVTEGFAFDKSGSWGRGESGGIPWPIKPPDSLASSPWYQSMPGRMREVLFLDHASLEVYVLPYVMSHESFVCAVCFIFCGKVLSLAALDSQKKDADVAYADVYHSATRFNTGPKTHIPIALP